MVFYADSISFADQVVSPARKSWFPPADLGNDVAKLTQSLYGGRDFHESRLEAEPSWKYLFAVESAPRSHYDLLIELVRGGQALPDGILCLAGQGERFHGLKDRPWSACPGNIHLSVHWVPARPIERFGVAFTILAAVSVVDAIDSIPGMNGLAGIRWVNDVVIDGSKVCGVLAHTQTMNAVVNSAIIGIGLNVEAKPPVEPTPFVPRVAALRDFAPNPGAITQAVVFGKLIEALDRNYRSLLGGRLHRLFERYCQRCVALGQMVTIWSDDSGKQSEIIARGRVRGLGEDLELYLEGVDRPVWGGRLVLDE